MRTAVFLVWFSPPIFEPLQVEFLHVLNIFYFYFETICQVDTAGFVLFDFDRFRYLLIFEQVHYFLIPYFHHIDFDTDLQVILFVFRDLKDLFDRPWRDSWIFARPMDGMCFSTTILSICEYADIMSVEGTLNQLSRILENLLLRIIGWIHLIIFKYFALVKHHPILYGFYGDSRVAFAF